MKKVVALIMAGLLSVSLVVGCGSKAPEQVTPETSKSEQQEVTSIPEHAAKDADDEAYYPITISTYTYDREPIELTFDKMPERVICAYQDNIELMLALGLEDKVIYAFGMDDEVSDTYADAFAQIDYSQQRPSKEDVIAMQPDFIMGWYSLFKEDRLDDINFWSERDCNTYIALNSGILGSSKDVAQVVEHEYEDILTIGKIFNCQEEAEAIVNQMKQEVDKAAGHAKSIETPRSVAILEDEGGTYRVYGANTLGGDIAKKAGATLAVGNEESSAIGAEDLIMANPDVIFMVWFNGYLTPEEAVAAITENPGLQSLKAVQNNAVYPLNLTSIYCSGIRTYEGIQKITQALYPELN